MKPQKKSLGSVPRLTASINDEVVGACNMKPRKPNNVHTIATILKAVCDTFGCEIETVKGATRQAEIKMCRFACMFYIRKYTDCTLETTGQVFNRHYSTVINAITQFENELDRRDSKAKLMRVKHEILSQKFDRYFK